MKRALITGITGQDGSYLAELLLRKGYEVHGIKRRSSSFNTGRVDHLYVDPHDKDVRFFLHYGDLSDSTNIIRLLQEVRPDEIYNLAAQSHVKVSFETPLYTANVDGLGTLRLLEAMRILDMGRDVRFYQASTSELFGKVMGTPQDETTPFYPRSPYGIAKQYAFWITRHYREAYGLFTSNGILFNHESPRRGETFVTRKITRAAARISLGLQKSTYLGNLDALRDWGHAEDFVESMWLILQHDEPDDFVIATGKNHSVREFAEVAFAEVGITLKWKGSGPKEKGVVETVDGELKPRVKPGNTVIRLDPRYLRPTEVDELLGDASKARRLLGWKPRHTFEAMVKEMVASDLEEAKLESICRKEGFRIRSPCED